MPVNADNGEPHTCRSSTAPDDVPFASDRRSEIDPANVTAAQRGWVPIPPPPPPKPLKTRIAETISGAAGWLALCAVLYFVYTGLWWAIHPHGQETWGGYCARTYRIQLIHECSEVWAPGGREPSDTHPGALPKPPWP